MDFKELTKLSGQYPTGVKFPQIYMKKSDGGRDHIGGYTELNDYLSPRYDFEALQEVSEHLTRNLNHIIDYNYYPTVETERSNTRHRPIGIGVQGLANLFFEYGY